MQPPDGASDDPSCINSGSPYRIQRHEHRKSNTVVFVSTLDTHLSTQNVVSDDPFDTFVKDFEKVMPPLTGRWVSLARLEKP